jgi:CheY-like chemotaxis protein
MTTVKEQNGHRVLLVDDASDLLALTSQCLECKGFEVVAAGNVPEALKCCHGKL